jgi:hypothetical protein
MSAMSDAMSASMRVAMTPFPTIAADTIPARPDPAAIGLTGHS